MFPFCNIFKISIRSPHRERRLFRAFDTRPPQISIHAPLTGSDLYRMRQGRYGILISIHAPLTGSDTVLGYDGDILVKFQSTLPHRSDNDCYAMYVSLSISIHAPSQGATSGANVTDDGYKISIHAPLTGSDQALFPFCNIFQDFNPRSPHRERR